MTIFVDADSCPVRVREIICKAACRIKCCAVFAANRPIPLPKAPFVRMAVTDTAEQAADAYILQNAAKGDLTVTRDIPLAKLLVDKGITVINDRGTCFTEDNIDSLVSARNFMYELQANGLKPETAGSFGAKEIRKFAGCLDTHLSKLTRQTAD